MDGGSGCADAVWAGGREVDGLSELRPLVTRLRRQLADSQRGEAVLAARLAERDDQLAAALVRPAHRHPYKGAFLLTAAWPMSCVCAWVCTA
jgi:hypothetical protein